MMKRLSNFFSTYIWMPFILTFIAVVVGFDGYRWSFASIPFIWLGAYFSDPNMNMIAGCLPSISIIIGLILLFFCHQLGIAIMVGAASGFCLSSFEKLNRMLQDQYLDKLYRRTNDQDDKDK